MSRLVAGLMVFTGGFVAVFFALVAYRYRAGQPDCVDAVAERYLEPVANTADGGWSWFPTGLSCTFTAEDGSLGVLTPNPVLTVVLLAGVASLLIGVVLLALMPHHTKVVARHNEQA